MTCERGTPSQAVSAARRFVLAAAAAAAITGCAADRRAIPNDAVDVLIMGGTVFTGAADEGGAVLDVGVRAGAIAFIGDAEASAVAARTRIAAEGLIVAPGFIDPHTHAFDDLMSGDRNQNTNYLTQGVTTVFVGNDGDGPVATGETLQAFAANGVGTNVALFVGHNAVREEVIGLEDRAPTPSELEEMRAAVRRAMEDGALGLSAGLYYVPGAFAETDELIALAEEIAPFGGVYDSHLRDEGSYTIGLLAAVEEAIAIGRESGAGVHIAHIKALGADVWGLSAEVIARVETARASGLSVTADQYPWRASGTRVSNALLPAWAREGEKEDVAARLRDPALETRLKGAMREGLRIRGGPDALLITAGPSAGVDGKTLAEVAAERGVEPIDAAIAIVLEGDARVASFNMDQPDIARFMAQPWVMTSSDGTQGHPRKFASFPRKYAHFVKERETLSLGAFIHRSTGLTAQTFQLCGRGLLKEGHAADIVVFDPDAFADVADFTRPERLSSGVVHLFVNGTAAIADGEPTGALAGTPLRRARCPGDE
ncbi:MAG: amidohydrolase family protein [Caulobacterales bacterium]|nr:amidohydrolase family protein [Caulobacterales bacterium]